MRAAAFLALLFACLAPSPLCAASGTIDKESTAKSPARVVSAEGDKPQAALDAPGILTGMHLGGGQLLDWTEQADIVCIGSPNAPGRKRGAPGMWGQIPVRSEHSVLRVSAVAKGGVARGGEIDVALRRIDSEALRKMYPHGVGLSGSLPGDMRLEPRRWYLLFLKQQQGELRLVNEGRGGESVVEVCPEAPEVIGDLPAVHKVSIQLLACLESNEARVQRAALSMLGGLGLLLWEKTGWMGTDWEPESVAKIGSDADRARLVDFVRARVVPAVVAKTRSQDAGVRGAAIMAAAGLQVTEVIPTLVKIGAAEAGARGIMESLLGGYHVRAAVPGLSETLVAAGQNAGVGAGVARSLRQIADPRGIPVLLDLLDSPDSMTRYLAASGLAGITHAQKVVAVDLFAAHEKESIAFWKEWAAEHQAEVAQYREELRAAAGSPVVAGPAPAAHPVLFPRHWTPLSILFALVGRVSTNSG